jgi:hypothetical protein
MVALNLKTTGAAAITMIAVAQLCPAPIPVIVLAAATVASIETAAVSGLTAGAAAAASGAVAGGVSGAVVKGSSKPPKRGLTESAKSRLTRRGEYAPSINQHDYDRCINEVNGQGVPVTFSDSEHGRVYSFVWDRR